MPGTVLNMVLGAPSSVKLGAYGTAEGACTDLGFTEGGVKITTKVETKELGADQAVGTLDVKVIGRGYTVEFDVAEPSLANFYKALGYPSTQLVGSALSLGISNATQYLTMYINGPGPGATTATRKVTLYRVVATGDPVMSLKKKDATVFTMKFTVLQDTSKSDAEQFGKIEDSGADTTAPTVVLTTPAEDGTVAKDTKGAVTLTFTEAGQGMDEGSLADGKTIMIMNVTAPAANVQVAGAWVYTAATKTLVFTPTANWTASDKLCVIITTAVRDMAGNYLETTYIGNFTVTA